MEVDECLKCTREFDSKTRFQDLLSLLINKGEECI